MTLRISLLVVAIVLGLSTISGVMSYNAISNEVHEKLAARLDQVAGKIEAEQNEVTASVELLGMIPVTRDLANELATIASLKVINEEKRTLEGYVEHHLEFVETLFIADKKGKIVVDGNGGSFVGIDIATRDYFAEAIATGKPAFSNIILSKGTGKPVRVFAVPIKSDSGQVTGVIAAALKMDPIFALLKDVEVGESGYAYMTDDTGLFVYHPNPDYMMTKKVNELGVEELNRQAELMMTGGSDKGTYTLEGVTKLNMFRPMGKFSLSINAVESEYLAPVLKMQRDMFIMGIVFFLIGIAVSALTAYVIVKRIRNMQAIMKQVEDGDLRVRVEVKGQDEVAQMGHSLNNMVAGFQTMITEIMKTTEILSSSSQQLAASAEEGGKAAAEVTANIEEITAGSEEQSNHITEINDMVVGMKGQMNESSQATIEMVRNSQAVQETAENGQEQMTETVKQMEEIQESSSRTYEVIRVLNEQSDQIGHISATISDIADQTNLLALNANIEAARAGEQGRGFAVVAEEVRKLAVESQESAQGIGSLITQIQDEISRALELIEVEKQAISKGIDTINTTGQAFVKINDRIKDTTAQITQVASIVTSAEESSETVKDSMEQISAVVQESTASAQEVSASAEEQNAIAEEIASASEQLSNMAEGLLQRVLRFKV